MEYTDPDITFPNKARRLIFNYIKEQLEKTGQHPTFSFSEVYIVWFCKTLQNWKALLATTLPDQKFYEVTYNGNKNEAYIDVYEKLENVVVPD